MATQAKQTEILERLLQIRNDIARKERRLQKLKRLSSRRSSSATSCESRPSVTDDSPPVPREISTLPQHEICEDFGSRTETAVSLSTGTSGAGGPVEAPRNDQLPLPGEDSCRSEPTRSSGSTPTSHSETPNTQLDQTSQRTALSPEAALPDFSQAGTRPEKPGEIERVSHPLYNAPPASSRAADQNSTGSPEVRSPLNKKKRRSARLDGGARSKVVGEYNLRKRKVTQSPATTATKESRMITNAFGKLMRTACTVPVLPFESCRASIFPLLFEQESASSEEAYDSSQSFVAPSPDSDPDCSVRRRQSSTRDCPMSPSTEDQETCIRQSDTDSPVFRLSSLIVEVVECEASRRDAASTSVQRSQAPNVSGRAANESEAEDASKKLGVCSQTTESSGGITDSDVKPILMSSCNSSPVEVKKENATFSEAHNASSDRDETNASLPDATNLIGLPLLHNSKCSVKTECFSDSVDSTPFWTPSAFEDEVRPCDRLVNGVTKDHTDESPALFWNSGALAGETGQEKWRTDVQPNVSRQEESPKTSGQSVVSFSESGSDDQMKDLIDSIVACLELTNSSQDDFGLTRSPGGDSYVEKERVLCTGEASPKLAGDGMERQESQVLRPEEDELPHAQSGDAKDGAEELLSMREPDEDESLGSAGSCIRRWAIGDQNPLMFFCTLKCLSRAPVTDVCILDSTPRVLVAIQARAVYMWRFAVVWKPSFAVTSLQYAIEGQHCVLNSGGSSFLVYLNSRLPSQLACVQWDLDAGMGSQLILTCGSKRHVGRKGRLRIYLLTRLSDTCVATASRTTRGTSSVRLHQLWYASDEVGDETKVVGHTPNALHSLVSVDGLPGALLGHSDHIVYVWNYEESVLLKEVTLEPDCVTDMHHICWASSDSGLLFLLMCVTGEEACHLLVTNPFTCKSQLVNSYTWSHATQRYDQSRRQQPRIQGRYMTCTSPDFGIRIWNLLGGNPVAEMRYKRALSVTLADFSEHCVVAVGTANGTVLVFTS